MIIDIFKRNLLPDFEKYFSISRKVFEVDSILQIEFNFIHYRDNVVIFGESEKKSYKTHNSALNDEFNAFLISILRQNFKIKLKNGKVYQTRINNVITSIDFPFIVLYLYNRTFDKLKINISDISKIVKTKKSNYELEFSS
jgi:hypothetical protein